MLDKYGSGQDLIYCYPNSDVLKNILEIYDQDRLNSAEVEFTQYRLATYQYVKLSEFNLETWKNIHFYLFQDIYEWAGELRTVKISKAETMFAMPSQLESYGNYQFQQLKKEKYLCELSRSQFVGRLAYHFGELNLLHPFREGNGRSQRLLFELIALNAGYALSWINVDNAGWIPANVAAAKGNSKPLEHLFEKVVVEISTNFS